VVITEAHTPMVNDSTPSEHVPGEEPARAPETPQEAHIPPGSHGEAEAVQSVAPAAEPDNKHWYVVKVQSGREESIKEAIERRVKIEGLQDSFGQVIIPVEKVTEMRNNKRVVKERKLYPGYLMVNVEFNDRILYLFRETSGVGDFVGGGLNKPPQPMKPQEVERLLITQGQESPGLVPQKSKFDKGDKVRVKDGTFTGMDGEVKEVLEAKGTLRVELTIFGRPVSVELEYWQVDYA
jgi:transcriptional antiterminator NusG